MRDKTYFLSDFHLGAGYHLTKAEQNNMQFPDGKDKMLFAQHELERKLCRWLDQIEDTAQSIYLLGDIFDYWFEYRYVVPRGYVRFLGKLAELTDKGVEIHFFIGNHDIWVTDYLQTEIGLIVHKKGLVTTIRDQKFYLHHGDGLGDESKVFQLLRKIFHNNFLRWLFAGIHPVWTVGFAKRWSNHSRRTGGDLPYLGEDKEYLIRFAKEELRRSPDINYFIFGHRHILRDLVIAKTSRVVILGDWITYFSYAVFDEDGLKLEIFEE